MRHAAFLRSTRLLLALLPPAFIALGSLQCDARVWRVQRDGSGDFTTIKPAITAASPGDTIELGPGRYDEAEQFSPAGAWSALTYVGVDKDNLTIRGTDRDAVIIGPTTQNFEGYGPLGFATHISVSQLAVENLTVENTLDGLYILGTATLSRLALNWCFSGVVGVDGASVQVDQCGFRSCTKGLFIYEGHDIEVANCDFLQTGLAVSFRFCQRANVRRCRVESGGGGTKHTASDGFVQGCTLHGQLNYGVASEEGGRVIADENVVVDCPTPLIATVHSSIGGTANLLRGTTYTVWLISDSTADLHFNDILPLQGLAFRADWYNPGTYVVDMSDNYWGVETEQEVAGLIHDGHDDPAIPFTVDFVPFSVRSVPNRPVSMGELKARFGPNQ
jgi:hypothetical protein